MFRSYVILAVLATTAFVFDTTEAQAHRRWVVRRPIARAVLGPPIIRRRVYRPYYARPRVVVGVGWGGGYYW